LDAGSLPYPVGMRRALSVKNPPLFVRWIEASHNRSFDLVDARVDLQGIRSKKTINSNTLLDAQGSVDGIHNEMLQMTAQYELVYGRHPIYQRCVEATAGG